MKKIKLKDKLYIQKKSYKILFVLIIVGIVIGLLYPFLLNSDNKNILKSSVTSFFNLIDNGGWNRFDVLKNSLSSNLIICLSIWLLGISIIGAPVVVFILLYKSFLFGFSFTSILSVYGFKGILASIFYVIPCDFVILITTLLLGFYSIRFSIKLFKYLFLKENINFSFLLNKYVKILCICLISFILCSLFESYLLPYLLRIFTFW